jgi:ubiquinone/menaquinone biosynthesis C-methylase UbiE
MEHQDHVKLIREGVLDEVGVWADFGAGTGAFSLALADLLPSQASLHCVDKNGRALKRLRQRMETRFPVVDVSYHAADFNRPLDLPILDGIVMANALHFQRNKEPLLRRLRSYLKPGGRFVLVEYNVDRGNPWVPYPLSYGTWEHLSQHVGLVSTRQLATRPSSFLGQIYSALSINPQGD